MEVLKKSYDDTSQGKSFSSPQEKKMSFKGVTVKCYLMN